MFETKVTYLSHKRKTYVTPWIHVRNVDLRGGMIMGTAEGQDSSSVITPETDPNDPNAGFSKQSLFFSDPFDTSFDDTEF